MTLQKVRWCYFDPSPEKKKEKKKQNNDFSHLATVTPDSKNI